MNVLKYDDSTEEFYVVGKESNVTTLDFLRQELNCNLVQPVRLDFGLDAWVDEEGLNSVNYAKINNITDIKTGNEYTMAGSLVITAYDDDGDTIGLTNEQFKYVNENIKIVSSDPMEYLHNHLNKYDDGLLG